jgi:hypothetical protein
MWTPSGSASSGAGTFPSGRIAAGDPRSCKKGSDAPPRRTSDAPAVTRHDLYRLVEDLEELAQVFLGDSCRQPVWAAEAKGKHQCRCSALAA